MELTFRKCRKCGLPVNWTGKSCTNPDGTDHWDKCSEARFAIIKQNGEKFSDSRGIGYRYLGKKHYTRIAKEIKGKNYVESDDKDCPF